VQVQPGDPVRLTAALVGDEAVRALEDGGPGPATRSTPVAAMGAG
jgi:hypothetical protein